MSEQKFRSRKFLIVASTLAFSTLALFTGHLEGSHYATIAAFCVGGYTASNAFAGRNQSVG